MPSLAPTSSDHLATSCCLPLPCQVFCPVLVPGASSLFQCCSPVDCNSSVPCPPHRLPFSEHSLHTFRPEAQSPVANRNVFTPSSPPRSLERNARPSLMSLVPGHQTLIRVPSPSGRNWRPPTSNIIRLPSLPVVEKGTILGTQRLSL